MIFKLASLTLLTLLAACATAATAQTTGHATHSATTHHTAAKAATPPNIPRVAGIPRTLYTLKYIDTKTGAGPLAEQHKYYTVRYTGWLADGTKFDSSYDHPGAEPITFPYGAHRVIIGWDTGFQGMRIGGKRRLFIPWQLAYGEVGRPPIPARADLIFDLELVAQSDTPPEPKQPTPPAATPKPQPQPAETAPDTTKPAPEATPAPQTATPPHPQSR